MRRAWWLEGGHVRRGLIGGFANLKTRDATIRGANADAFGHTSALLNSAELTSVKPTSAELISKELISKELIGVTTGKILLAKPFATSEL